MSKGNSEQIEKPIAKTSQGELKLEKQPEIDKLKTAIAESIVEAEAGNAVARNTIRILDNYLSYGFDVSPVQVEQLREVQKEADQSLDSNGKPIFREFYHGYRYFEEIKAIESRLKAVSSFKVNGETMEQATSMWCLRAENDMLQLIGNGAKKNPDYLNAIHAILREQYPFGFIKLYRGLGVSGYKALERQYVNTTSNIATARGFEYGNRFPAIADIWIKLDDVVAIGDVGNSELIIPSAILKDRIAHRLNPFSPEEIQVAGETLPK